MVVFAAMVAVEGCRMIVDCGCLQRIAADGIARQPSVRRGTASKDGACGIGIVGRLGWQRTAAGCLAWLGYPVRYIVENGASDFFDLLTWHRRLCARVKQGSEVDMQRRLNGLMEIRGGGASSSTTLTAT